METKFLTSIVMVGAIIFSGCEDAVETGLTEAEITQQILDRIEKNEGISYNMFQLLNERITADSLMLYKREASAKADFIETVTRNSDDYFNEVVESGISEFNISTIPTPFAGDAEAALKMLVARDSAFVDDYSNFILKQLEEQADKDDHRQWIVVDAISSSETPSSAKPKPTETISLNYEKMKFLVSIAQTILNDQSETDGGIWKTVNFALDDDDISPVAIGMLLPAVQKIREAAATEPVEPFGTAMNSWLDGPITQAINGGLNRDIIRRIHATVYLAGIHALISEEYAGTSVDMASLSVLHARYRAALIAGSATVWDASKK